MVDLLFSRRNFLRVGAVLPFLGLDTLNYAAQPTHSDHSVIFVWLGGGASHIELFNPVPEAPAEYRSIHGAIKTNVSGIEISGGWKNLANHCDKVTIVRSFGHSDATHETATHWLLSGHENTDKSPGTQSKYPSLGAITCSICGPNNTITGIPTYVSMSKIDGDGPSWLGGQYGPYLADQRGIANLTPTYPQIRASNRYELLKGLDKLDEAIDTRGNMKTFTELRPQSYNLLYGKAREAFDLSKESAQNREKYGKNGEQLLMARRLIEAGAKFVSCSFNGWDTHADMDSSLPNLITPLDIALSALLEDLPQNCLLVLTSEFGRTPRLNKGLVGVSDKRGRDHWSNVNSLMFAGGNFNHGRIIGTTNNKAEEIKDDKCGPIDLQKTIADWLELPHGIQKNDFSGRPRYLIEGGKNILNG